MRPIALSGNLAHAQGGPSGRGSVTGDPAASSANPSNTPDSGATTGSSSRTGSDTSSSGGSDANSDAATTRCRTPIATSCRDSISVNSTKICRKGGVSVRAHTVGSGFKLADLTRRASLLQFALSCCCWCCCLPRRCCSRRARGAKNLAAQRCSHRLSMSKGILLTTNAPGLPSPPVEDLNARRPVKVPQGISGADLPFKL